MVLTSFLSLYKNNRKDVRTMNKEKEVVTLDKFGICPLCHRHMGMLHSVYTFYGMTESGKYPNRILGEPEEDYTLACLCGYRKKMIQSVYGLYPEGHIKIEEEEKIMTTPPKDFILGYIDEDEDQDSVITKKRS